MSVVAHHKIIILSESIAAALRPVDKNPSVTCDFKIITLISRDDSLVQRKVQSVKPDSSSFPGNPYRPVVVSCPPEILLEREKGQI